MTLPLELQRLYQAAIAYEVASGHAHALRNVLGGIFASTCAIRRRLEVGGRDDGIVDAVGVIDQRVHDVVALTARRPRLPGPPASELVVADVVNELLASIPIPRGLRVSVSGPKRRGGRIVAVADELKLAVHCLVENAMESVASRDEGALRIRIGEAPEGLVVEVLDDGPGIDPAILDDVFQRFFTTKEGHLGMGLNVARTLAMRLGGRVVLESARPRGVRAAITLASSARGARGLVGLG